MTTTGRRLARVFARVILTVGLLAGLGLVLLGSLGRGPSSPPEAPLPTGTFDVRGSQPAGTPSPSGPAAARRSTPGRAVAAARAPVPDPSRLRIPALGVDAPVSRERVTASGELVVPGDPRAVGSWRAAEAASTSPSAAAATAGVLVLAGHVDSDGSLGALHPLSQVTPGMRVVTADAAGHEEIWDVDALEVRRKDDLPAFAPDGPRRLAIVTCGGPAVEDEDHTRAYRDNVIAWASPTP